MDRPGIDRDILGAYGRPAASWIPFEYLCMLRFLSAFCRYPLVIKIPQAEMNGGTIGRLVCSHTVKASSLLQNFLMLLLVSGNCSWAQAASSHYLETSSFSGLESESGIGFCEYCTRNARS